MEFDRLPSKPVVKSLTGAQAEWENWLFSNNFQMMRDADGVDWRVAMTFEQLPSELDRHKGKWIATLQIGADVPIARLVETGTLDPEQDERLIILAGSGAVPLRMKKLRYEALGENEMRETLVRVLPELRENFRKTSLHEVKRSLIHRWVEGLSSFGQREILGVQLNLSEDFTSQIDSET
jgi:hypothetical protein